MPGVAPFTEVRLSTRETAKVVAAAEAAKKLRKIGPALYTSNMTDPVEAVNLEASPEFCSLWDSNGHRRDHGPDGENARLNIPAQPTSAWTEEALCGRRRAVLQRPFHGTTASEPH